MPSAHERETEAWNSVKRTAPPTLIPYPPIRPGSDKHAKSMADRLILALNGSIGLAFPSASSPLRRCES